MKPFEEKSVYKRDRPSLVIEITGGRQISNCYYAGYYRITSTNPLDGECINMLRKSGVVGFGQEFTFYQQGPEGQKIGVIAKKDWQTPTTPSGHDMVECVDITADGTRTQAKDFRGNLIEPRLFPYYVYLCESRVDSGD
jgi:hypothetical protein